MRERQRAPWSRYEREREPLTFEYVTSALWTFNRGTSNWWMPRVGNWLKGIDLWWKLKTEYGELVLGLPQSILFKIDGVLHFAAYSSLGMESMSNGLGGLRWKFGNPHPTTAGTLIEIVFTTEQNGELHAMIHDEARMPF